MSEVLNSDKLKYCLTQYSQLGCQNRGTHATAGSIALLIAPLQDRRPKRKEDWDVIL